MKKADNFNPGKWLVENKITFQSRLNEININGKTVKKYTQNGDKSYTVTYEDDTKETIMVSNDGWDTINNANLKEIERMPDTDYEDAWEKGGGMDDEEFDFWSAKIVNKPFPDAKGGKDRMIPTLVVDETGDEFQEFYILNTPEDEEKLKRDQEMGREIEGVFKVKMDDGDVKTAVVYPPTKSKSEFSE